MEKTIKQVMTEKVSETLSELKNGEIGKENYLQDLIETVRAVRFMIDDLYFEMVEAGKSETTKAKKLFSVLTLIGMIEKKIDIKDFPLIRDLLFYVQEIDRQTENN